MCGISVKASDLFRLRSNGEMAPLSEFQVVAVFWSLSLVVRFLEKV